MASNRITFPHARGYLLLKELGQGACGKTVLLHDDAIDELFVCKKYAPQDDRWRESLFTGFLREIKLMHGVQHVNVVRVFNYVVYPDRFSGYIFMEYVDGTDIDEHLSAHPEDVNSLFEQVVEGFNHLESRQILHRDIRTTNILVGESGIAKIIDFGFGKQVAASADFDKSISLNWWCAPPAEFSDGIYNHASEVYFVGKLFEALIAKHDLQNFRYDALLRRMIEPSISKRVDSFALVRQEMLGSPSAVEFEYDDVETYRTFANALADRISKIGAKAGCYGIDEIQRKLEEAYKTMMLETDAPNSAAVIGCVVSGSYRYLPKRRFPVSQVREFLDLIKRCDKHQRNIVEANLRARIEAIDRLAASNFDDMDDDIPF